MPGFDFSPRLSEDLAVYLKATRPIPVDGLVKQTAFVGLCRAAGIPARELYGIRVGESAQFKSIGKSGVISKAQHCRAEYYSESQGWVAVDPADLTIRLGISLSPRSIRS